MDPHPRSPLLDLPDAVDGEGADAGVAAHYGSFNGEQRTLAGGHGFVDLSHRGVVRVEGPDRLTWLHSLTTQQLEGLAPGEPVITLVLSPQGHVEHALYGVDDGTAFTAHVEPGRAADLVAWLDRMRFLMRVEVTDVTAELAVAWRPTPVVEPVEPPRWSSLSRPRAGSISFLGTSWPPSPRRRARPAAPGPTRRSGSRAASRGSDTTRTTAPSPTRSAGSAPVRTPRCIWTRAATAARRRSPACTRSAGRRDG